MSMLGFQEPYFGSAYMKGDATAKNAIRVELWQAERAEGDRADGKEASELSCKKE